MGMKGFDGFGILQLRAGTDAHRNESQKHNCHQECRFTDRIFRQGLVQLRRCNDPGDGLKTNGGRAALATETRKRSPQLFKENPKIDTQTPLQKCKKRKLTMAV